MKKEDWAEFLKYLSPYSILVVSNQNKLVEIHCPFQVEVLDPVGKLDKGKCYLVQKVMLSTNLTTVFIIEECAYYYYHFNIKIK
ncbi:hypothetical protein LCGC14_0354310 [marine sediment metagenome]|uniref:Uncharacterized protein n=1 Tax=marine sediment metagenome TaxID=412755 RepID=A0A0F9VX13_9ZZZZ|nr:hypothetical protein [Maribacter sp.]HDZ04675.1 hypothetical protein [Maribacter sp.]